MVSAIWCLFQMLEEGLSYFWELQPLEVVFCGYDTIDSICLHKSIWGQNPDITCDSNYEEVDNLL